MRPPKANQYRYRSRIRGHMRAAFRHIRSLNFWDNRWRTTWNNSNGLHYPGWLMPDSQQLQLQTMDAYLRYWMDLFGPIPAPTDMPVHVPPFPPPPFVPAVAAGSFAATKVHVPRLVPHHELLPSAEQRQVVPVHPSR